MLGLVSRMSGFSDWVAWRFLHWPNASDQTRRAQD
jgi:hypothetical protein